ncbi:hypothetical protein H6F89_25085 [Cyanobacteria bacterium FACHB-63]|nr:hypothetical protein [Cyanobacteria bacterium FACHB-63]
MRRTIAASLGLAIALLGSSTRAEETQVIDNTPSLPSICQITPNSKISYGKISQVLNPSGGTESVVFDQNYDDTFSGLFSGRKTEDRKLFFTVWFAEGILFTGHQEDPLYKGNWSSYRMYGSPSEYGTGERFSYFVRIGNAIYPLEISEVSYQCKYGAEEISWHRNVSSPVALKFSSEARAALKNSQQTDKVEIVYRRKDGNKTYETSTPIGSATISAWKQLQITATQRTSTRTEDYPSDSTIGLASESLHQHSKAWISNDYDEIPVTHEGKTYRIPYTRLAGTYQGSKGMISFVAMFKAGNGESCFYAERGEGTNLHRKTTCHTLTQGNERTLFVSLASGNNMQIRYNTDTSEQELNRFQEVWLKVTGESPIVSDRR